jgi:hypothetical protein
MRDAAKSARDDIRRIASCRELPPDAARALSGLIRVNNYLLAFPAIRG